MIGIIAAVSMNGVIGFYENGIGKLPFYYPEDLKHFKRTTKGSIVVMGRKTFESMGSKPLFKRTNVVLSRKGIDYEGVTVKSSIDHFMSWYMHSGSPKDLATKDIWFIGGASVYREAMVKEIPNEIHLTLAPDYIEHDNPVLFPWINPSVYELKEMNPMSEHSDLLVATYTKVLDPHDEAWK